MGLELSGAKNEKTAIAALEYYPKEHKIFLLDVYEKIVGKENQSGDEALLEAIDEIKSGVTRMGVNVPLTLPPCFNCKRSDCSPGKCSNPATQWMRKYSRKMIKGESGKSQRARNFTPYTQRPIELYVRHQLLPELPETARFEVDEALGGNKAPLTARMIYLKRFLEDLKLVEVWPKLSIATLGAQLGISNRTVSSYRNLEEGAHARAEILESLADQHGIFIYDRDHRKLSASLPAFDAFICAYTALLADTGYTAKPPAGFPVASGWVEYPHAE